ncbi:MAG: response regulator [Candidatus Omnitrophica bacterium]|nr:response regulator [Candidatus Omnitrophota bacterium]
MNKPLEGEPLVILHVEDDEAQAELVKRSLAQNRVRNRVLNVYDGEEALDYFFHRGKYSDKLKSPKPHLILLDIRLPKIDGLEVLKQLKTNDSTKKIPIVILTSSAQEEDLAKAYEYHVNSYVVKPFDYENLLSLMHDLGFYWLSWNNLPWVIRAENDRNYEQSVKITKGT